jgi:hypothetical protein
MAFLEGVILQAWRRSDGRCECTRDGHDHDGRCGAPLVWSLRHGILSGGWIAARRMALATDVLENCEIRCSGCYGRRDELITPLE